MDIAVNFILKSTNIWRKVLPSNICFSPGQVKGSDSYNKAVSVWCAKDRNAALTAAKKDQKMESKTCANPIDKHMQLSEEFGAQGTPMIVTENGNVSPGYVPAKQLVEMLQAEKAGH